MPFLGDFVRTGDMAVFPPHSEGNDTFAGVTFCLKRWQSEISAEEAATLFSAWGDDIFWFDSPASVRAAYVLLGEKRYLRWKEWGVPMPGIVRLFGHRSPQKMLFSAMLCVGIMERENLLRNRDDVEDAFAMFEAYYGRKNLAGHFLTWWRALYALPAETRKALARRRTFLRWEEHFKTPEEALRWLAVGFPASMNPRNVAAWRNQGFSVEEAGEWLAAGWPRGATAAKEARRRYDSNYTVQEMVLSEGVLQAFKPKK